MFWFKTMGKLHVAPPTQWNFAAKRRPRCFLQVRHPAADSSPHAGPSAGEGDGGKGAGGGDQRVVLRRQVLRKDPSRSASQIYEIKLQFVLVPLLHRTLVEV